MGIVSRVAGSVDEMAIAFFPFNLKYVRIHCNTNESLSLFFAESGGPFNFYK